MGRLEEEITSLNGRKERESINLHAVLTGKAGVEKEAEEAAAALAEKTEVYNEAVGELAALTEKTDSCRNELFMLSSEISRAKSEAGSLQTLQETLKNRQSILLEEKGTGEDSGKRVGKSWKSFGRKGRSSQKTQMRQGTL